MDTLVVNAHWWPHQKADEFRPYVWRAFYRGVNAVDFLLIAAVSTCSSEPGFFRPAQGSQGADPPIRGHALPVVLFHECAAMVSFTGDTVVVAVKPGSITRVASV